MLSCLRPQQRFSMMHSDDANGDARGDVWSFSVARRALYAVGIAGSVLL
jgi:hypothetical protein